MHALALVRAAGSRLACASLPTPDQQPQPLHRYVVPPRAVERPAVVPRHTPAPTRTSGASPAVRLVLHYTGGPSTTDARAKTTNPTARSAAAGARPRRVRGTPSDSDGQAATPVTRPADTSPFSAPPPPPRREASPHRLAHHCRGVAPPQGPVPGNARRRGTTAPTSLLPLPASVPLSRFAAEFQPRPPGIGTLAAAVCEAGTASVAACPACVGVTGCRAGGGGDAGWSRQREGGCEWHAAHKRR